MDYRELNKATLKNRYPLPFIDCILDAVAGHKYFSFCDGYAGFHQIPMRKSDVLKPTFVTPWGTYCYLVMPFGLEGGLGTYQETADIVFKGLEFVKNFIDDFVVFSTRNDHLSCLRVVLERVDAAKMGLNPDKCKFCVRKGALLGHKVSADGVEVDSCKVQKILARRVLETLTETRSFVAAAQYYKRLIPSFATMAKPLFAMTKKEEKDFTWTAACQKAFEEIKEELMKSVVVKAPRWEDPFYLSLTVTSTTFEFDLYQLKTAEGKLLRPVYFANRLMKDAESRYSLIEKHVACLVAGVKKFHHYLAGARQFKVV